MNKGNFTYPGGFAKLVNNAPEARLQYSGIDAFLSDLSAEGLGSLAQNTLPESPPAEDLAESAAEKYAQLRTQFSGQSELLALHALTIAAARRRDPPAIAQQLFLDIWQHHAPPLLKHLDTRWKISALVTFRDFGTTEAQRRCASELSVFFNLTKLYESERLYSGFTPDTAFPILNRTRAHLTLRLSPYSLRGGDLDRNLMAMLWLSAEEDPILRPLACNLLTAVNKDKNTLFRRLRLMKRAFKNR
ncbi:MAG: hypothetical protein GY883_07490 [Shimia sp.]|nr:hypothetical protein [Shimia sp.]